MNKELKKEDWFKLLESLDLSPENLAQIREWTLEYSTRQTDTLPCPVQYIVYDNDDMSCGFIGLTTHLSELEGGDPVIAHLGVKLLLYPINGKSSVQTIAALQNEAKFLWKDAHPLTIADWNKFLTHQKTYMDLNKILKGLKRVFYAVENEPGLLDIRNHIYYLHDITDPHYTMCTRLDVETGDTKVVPISTIDYILCAVD